jgi:hypothetical protein
MTRTEARRRSFLRMLRSGISVGEAVTALGVSRRTAYDWRRSDAAFAAPWDAIQPIGSVPITARHVTSNPRM